MGVCVPGGERNGVLLGKCAERGQGELRREVSVRNVGEGAIRTANDTRGELPAECVGALRHARERVGVVRGWVWAVSKRFGDGSAGSFDGIQPCHPRGLVVRLRPSLPFSHPGRGRSGLLRRQLWIPRCLAASSMKRALLGLKTGQKAELKRVDGGSGEASRAERACRNGCVVGAREILEGAARRGRLVPPGGAWEESGWDVDLAT